MDHKGWNRRGYLPHCDFAGNLQAITFRLADSLPANAIEKWKREIETELRKTEDSKSRGWVESALRRRMAAYEDSGHGACLLGKPEYAEMVQQALIENHSHHYRLIDWCVMPNHVHVLIKEMASQPLGKIIQRWKGSSSVKINRGENREGRLWMPDYHDRLIRDEDHFYNARSYIRQNPVKARLCGKAEDWTYSSCGIGWNPESRIEEAD